MNRSPLSTTLLTLACALVLHGCAAFPVETDYDPAVDFGALESYEWLARPEKPVGDPRLDNDLLDARVRRAVDEALASKGYRRVEEGAADFQVTYHVSLERQVDVQTYVDPASYGYRWHAGPSHAYTSVREYDVGSLVLDIVDTAHERLIWRGATQARIAEDGTPEQRDQRTSAAVYAILAKFPPQ